MVDKSVITDAPKGATHYSATTRTYHLISNDRRKYFFSKSKKRWTLSFALPADLVCITSVGWADKNRPEKILAQLPEHVRPHVTQDPKTQELVLWDETGAHEVCKSHYPLVIVTAMEVYSREYLNKH